MGPKKELDRLLEDQAQEGFTNQLGGPAGGQGGRRRLRAKLPVTNSHMTGPQQRNPKVGQPSASQSPVHRDQEEDNNLIPSRSVTKGLSDPALGKYTPQVVIHQKSNPDTPRSTNSPQPINSKAESSKSRDLAPPIERSSSRSNMSSQRRGARNGARGDSHDGGINAQELWNEISASLQLIAQGEKRAKELGEQIFALEIKLKDKKDAGQNISAELDQLDALYREQVKITEQQKPRATSEALKNQLELLRDIKKASEQQQKEDATAASARASSSRASAMEFDGPSDSPVPSPAENRAVRKIGAPRTSSQPPRSNSDRHDGTPSEASERASKPKIVYVTGEEVAFKRKTPGKPEESDWIQGTVVRVIGEGKSRRYEVRDDYPEPGSNAGNNIYKSSASQMVPIPPEGTKFEDYEVGKRVLALYPHTSTFYRGEVKGMLKNGTAVELLFEEETAGELKEVERRFVLDHKG